MQSSPLGNTPEQTDWVRYFEGFEIDQKRALPGDHLILKQVREKAHSYPVRDRRTTRGEVKPDLRSILIDSSIALCNMSEDYVKSLPEGHDHLIKEDCLVYGYHWMAELPGLLPYRPRRNQEPP